MRKRVRIKRDDAHWQFEDHRQRVTTKQWRLLLLHNLDKLTFNGHLRQLKAKSLGAGVYEIYKEPLTDDEKYAIMVLANQGIT